MARLKRSIGRFPVHAATGVVLLALIALAVPLRLSSTREVSAVQLERTQRLLNDATRRFVEDFDREITRAVIYFAISHSDSETRVQRQLVKRLEHWRENSPHPQLVTGLSWQRGKRLEPRALMSLDSTTGVLLPVSWPNRFDSIIEPPTRHLEARDEAGATFRDEIPALVLPWLSERPEAVGGEGGEGGGAPDGHVIIELDHDYIVEEFLPSLAERHLSIGDGVTYQALIVRRTDPPEIVYQTADGLSLQDFSTPDESRYLFDLLSERQYRELLLNVGLSLGMLIPESPEAHEDFAAAQVPASVLSEGESDFGRWQILVRHPAGSLQQAFDQRRRRGIAVNLGLFGLLGAMAVLLVVSTQRAQRLASQQLDIVAGVSHELRTPLSVIRMAAGNLERGAVRNEESVKRYAALIGSEERRLSEMVERALAFGQMQSRDQCFDRELVSVAQIIEAAVGDCRPLIERHQARIERDNTPGDLQVRGDAQALRHAVQNLVANAIKHSGPSPCVRIQARRSESGEAGEVTIRVADEGRGISPEDLPRIFEPFFRGRRTGNGPVEGTGLGLTLVEEIVEAHEGRVTVESDRSGSVFTIRLPDRGSS